MTTHPPKKNQPPGRSAKPGEYHGSDDRDPTLGERQSLMRLASAGFELASFSLILAAVGYAADRCWGWATPFFAILGLFVGFSLGFYRLIVLANKMN